ncbi:MAG: copper transport protein [Pseudonocardiales bacterium]|jgi:copper transport protein|nr:copper transport protein [Pseudonocardiales bacterium]
MAPIGGRVAKRAARLILFAVAMAFGLIVLGPAAPAGAHAFLSDSNPADGAVLTSAPADLRLQFSESVVLEATRIDIVDSLGRHHSPTALHLVRSGPADSTEEPAQVIADLPRLGQSAYRVSWQTLSSDDLHRTSGLLVFGINQPVKAAGFVEPKPRAEEAALRWLLFLGLAAAIGAQLTSWLYRRVDGDANGRARRRCQRLSALGAALAALVAVGLLVDQLAGSGSSVGRLLLQSYGARWMLREVGLILLVAVAIRGIHSPAAASVVRRLLVWVGVACACIGSALLGHAGSGRDFAPTRALADASHLAAAAAWSGLLITAVLIVVPALRNGSGGAASSRAVLRGFRVPAAACVSVMIVTGIYLASGLVGSVDAALFTFYGRTLLLKLGVVAVIAVLGLVNTRPLHSRRFSISRRTVLAEAGLAMVVLALAAVLTSGQPAREPQFVAARTLATVGIVDGGVADLQESLAIRPNQPGRNVVVVEVFNTRRPEPAPVRRVLVSIVGLDSRQTAPVAAAKLADGRWSVAANLDSPGRTQIRVTVQRVGLPDATHAYPWVVGGGPTPLPATLSNAPLAGPLAATAGILVALLAMAWAAAFWRWRRRRPHHIGGTGRDGQAPEHIARRDVAQAGIRS